MKKRYYVIYFVTLAFFWFGIYAYNPILGVYAESIGINLSMIGLILGSYGFAQVVFKVLFGILTDRIGSKKVIIIIGACLVFCSSLGLWLSKSSGFLLLFRFMAGVAASTQVAFIVLFAQYTNDRQATRTVGYMYACEAGGLLLALYLSGIVTQRFSYQSAFVLAMIGSTIAIAFSLFIKDVKGENKAENASRITFKSIMQIATDKRIILYAALATFIEFISFTTISGFTPVVAKSIGATNYQLGLLTFVAFLPAMIAGFSGSAFIIKTIGEKKALIGGYVLLAICCIAIPISKNVTQLYVAQGFLGFSKGILSPLITGLAISNVQRDKMSSTLGFFQSVCGLGMFAGSSVSGLIGNSFGINTAFYCAAIVALIGMLLVAKFVHNNRKEELEGIRI